MGNRGKQPGKPTGGTGGTGGTGRPVAWAAGAIDLTIYIKGRQEGVKVVKTKTVQAMVCSGLVAIHPGILPDTLHKWLVTHVASGLHIITVDCSDDAIKVAERLASHSAAALEKRRAEEVLAVLGADVTTWLKACGKAGKYLNPE